MGIKLANNKTHDHENTLRTICIRKFRLQGDASDLSGSDTLPIRIAGDLWGSHPFYHHNPPCSQRTDLSLRISRQDQKSKLVYLSLAILIVVPTTMITHQTLVIEKHVPTLHALVLSHKDPMPKPTELGSKWDVIILTFERFAKEYVHGFGHSVFFECRFRRLIIDEGNKLAGRSRVVVPSRSTLGRAGSSAVLPRRCLWRRRMQ